jgi:hypothetical protein
MKLKINFVDFWPGFNKKNNYFYHLLRLKYNVLIDEKEPDLLFFSVDYQKLKERNKYKNHKCKKIFYTGENVRANFSNFDIDSERYSIGKCDFAFTFDFINHPRHFRLPLWVTYIDWFNVGGYENPEYLLPPEKISSNEFIDKTKDKFCSIVISNPEPKRIDLFNKLNKYRQVDGYGKIFGKWTSGEKNKYEIISNYRFSICLENSISPYGGYYTEKLFHAKTAGTIPLYWSDKKCSNDFNEKSFINLTDFETIDQFVDYIKEVDNNKKLYENYLKEPLFLNNKINDEFMPENVLKFFEEKVLC